jgi:hypothetical protein
MHHDTHPNATAGDWPLFLLFAALMTAGAMLLFGLVMTL